MSLRLRSTPRRGRRPKAIAWVAVWALGALAASAQSPTPRPEAPAPVLPVDPPRLRLPIPSEPGGAVEPVELFAGALRINGELEEVAIPSNQSIRPVWSFPLEAEIDRVFLRVRRGRFPEGEALCPAEGTPFLEGVRQLDERDGALSRNLSGRQRSPLSVSDGRLVGDDLFCGSCLGEESNYASGFDYSFVACGLSTGSRGADTFSASHSNEVVVRYDYFVAAPIRPAEYCHPLIPDPRPELEIVEVVVENEIERPWEVAPVTALVRNRSTESVSVRAAIVRASLYPADEPLVGFAMSEVATVPPGRVVPILVRARPSDFRLEEVYPAPLSARVFLIEPEIDPEEAVLGILGAGVEAESVFRSAWRDSNVCDNIRALSLAIAPPTHFSVTARIDRMTVNTSCDHVSPGDWFFETRVCPGAPTAGGCLRDPTSGFWPDRPLDLGSGDVLTPVRFSDLGQPVGRRSFRMGQRVNVELVGWECDAGSFREHSIQCRDAEEGGETLGEPKGTAFGGSSSVVFSVRRSGTHRVPLSFSASSLPLVPAYRNHCGEGAFSAEGFAEITPRWWPE